jgi:hypothetical protein
VASSGQCGAEIPERTLSDRSPVDDVATRAEQSGTDVRSQDVVHDVGERGIPGREIHLQQIDEQTIIYR